MSLNPITKNYRELTPYRFASNRPIDEIDLDGKDYYYYYYADGAFAGHRITDAQGKMLDTKTASDVRIVTTIIIGQPDIRSSDPNKNRLTLYSGVTDLNISHEKFIQSAAVAYGESSVGNASNYPKKYMVLQVQ